MDTIKFEPPATPSIWDKWLDSEINKSPYDWNLKSKKEQIEMKYKNKRY